MHEQVYRAPIGKVVRNPAMLILDGTAIVDDCVACNGSGYVPEKIVESVMNFARTPERAQEYLNALKWNHDHYSFNCRGIYVGIESDGFLHS
jgi:hypothetical protein